MDLTQLACLLLLDDLAHAEARVRHARADWNVRLRCHQGLVVNRRTALHLAVGTALTPALALASTSALALALALAARAELVAAG